MSLKFKKQETIYSSEPYYDLFDGGYINPFHMLKDVDEAQRVQDAITVVLNFLADAEQADALEIT